MRRSSSRTRPGPRASSWCIWWSTPVDLRLQYFRAPLDEPANLVPLPATHVGCVWELALANHERVSWVRHMLVDQPDLTGYLTAAPPEHV